MHLDEEQVQRLLHGELGRSAEASAREHVAGCPDCRRRLAVAEREEAEVYALLGGLDHAPPPVSADTIAAKARGQVFAWGRWAAGIIVAIGLASASYAIPGSPVRAWVGAVVDWVGGRSGPSSVNPPESGIPDRGVAGIAVAPGRTLLIVFTSPQAEGRVQVSLTDGADVGVRGPIGAATFTSDGDRLVIDNRGSSATFEIQIPRAAPRVEIQVGESSIFLKEGHRISTEQSTEPSGPYILPLTPSAP